MYGSGPTLKEEETGAALFLEWKTTQASKQKNTCIVNVISVQHYDNGKNGEKQGVWLDIKGKSRYTLGCQIPFVTFSFIFC